MSDTIATPRRGEPLRASWAQQMTARVNSIGVVGSSGLLVRDCTDGYGFERLPENKRQPKVNGGLAPFAVRYVEQSQDDASIPYTGFEIYMPTGCVTVGATCLTINPAAYRLDEDAQSVPLTGWYRLSAPGTSPADGDSWHVIVHAKCTASRFGQDTISEWPKRLVWAEAQNTDMTQAEREAFTGDIGDTLAVTVGTLVFSENDDDEIVHSYTHTIKTAIVTTESSSTQPMSLLFDLSVDSDTVDLSLSRLFVRNQVFSAAGATFVADTLFEVDPADEAVYLAIDTRTTPYTGHLKRFATITGGTNNTMSVPAQVSAARQPGEIWLQLFGLKNGHVTLNNLSALSNIQVYQ